MTAFPTEPRPSELDRSASGLGRSIRLLRTLEHASDLDQFERMLLTIAVGPDGPGFDRAQFLTWDARQGVLVDRHRAWRGMRSSAALESVALREGDSDARTFIPARLTGAAAAAWQNARAVIERGQPRDGEPAPAQVAGAPVRARGAVFGLLVGEWFTEPTGRDRLLALEDTVHFLEAALDAHDRSEEARRRARQLTALAELSTAVVSPLNLAEVLHLVARLAAQASHAGGSALWIQGKLAPRLEVTYGVAGVRERVGRTLTPVATAVIESARPRTADPATSDPLLARDAGPDLAAVSAFPLVAYDRTVGAFAVYHGARPHPAARGIETEHEFLASLADLAALAVDQASRFQQLRETESKNRDLVGQLRRESRLSSLGELSAQLSKEAKNPVASIRAFARRVHEGLAQEEPAREYLEIVMREADRLERLLKEQSEHAIVEPPALTLGNVNDVVQNVLQTVGETLVRRRIRLLKKLSPEVPALLFDAERMRRVAGNVLQHALELVAVGGRIRVETRRLNQHVVLEIGHDGPHSPGDALEELFVPFSSSRPGGPAVGLSLAHRLVREHGGEVRVRSEGEWSTIVTVTLPIFDNRDRRRPGTDRRHARADRRARVTEAG